MEIQLFNLQDQLFKLTKVKTQELFKHLFLKISKIILINPKLKSFNENKANLLKIFLLFDYYDILICLISLIILIKFKIDFIKFHN